MRLKGKVAIVTGGGRGIGREIAMLYAEEGADVTVTARSRSEIEAVAEEIKALGRRALAIVTDVREESQVNEMVHHTLGEFGKIDILVNNAGGALGTVLCSVWDLSLQQWREVLDTNLTGTFLCCKAVLPQMIKQRGGIIINVSSAMGQRGRAGFGAYSAAKFGVEGLTQVLAAELAAYNIRVNSLCPGGRVATPSILKQPSIPNVPLLRTDIVRPLVLFLASDDSTGRTGEHFDCKEWNQEHGFGDISQYLYQPPNKLTQPPP